VEKILHIDTGRALRGGQRQLLLLAEALKTRDFQQYIASPAAKEIGARIEDLPILPLSRASLARKLRVRPLLHLIANERIRLVHAHDSEAHTIALILKWLVPNLTVVVTRRVIFPPSGFFSRKLKYNRLVDRYIAISEAVAEALTEAGLSRERIQIIPDGVDVAKIDEVRADHEIVTSAVGAGKKVIVAAGALTAEKDFATAVRAFAKIGAGRSDVALLIFGEGPLRSALEAQVAELNCQNIVFAGTNENLAAAFKACQIYLSTSVSEGLGSAAILAGACGLPAVVSDAGGLPEVVENGVNGIVCPAGNADRFAAALQSLLDDNSLCQKMAESARSKAQEFDIRIQVEKTAELYNSLLARPPLGV
jgi:L-malate glycosyltransferase